MGTAGTFGTVAIRSGDGSGLEGVVDTGNGSWSELEGTFGTEGTGSGGWSGLEGVFVGKGDGWCGLVGKGEGAFVWFDREGWLGVV